MAEDFHTTTRIKTAVVTGQHPFDVPAFHALFRSMPEIDFYPQHLDDFVADDAKVRKLYDAVVFYNFHQETPGDDQKAVRQAIEQLGEVKQGIVVLHHAILAYRQWPVWSELCGFYARGFGYDHDQTVHVEIANRAHPITQGLADWDMIDETYSMDSPKAEDGNDILLTVTHPLSMKVIGWTRQHKNARVFCFQSGHDGQTFANPGFHTVLSRGIQWAAGRM